MLADGALTCRWQSSQTGSIPQSQQIKLLTDPTSQSSLVLAKKVERRRCSLMISKHLLLADKGIYQRVGEASELALRVLPEKIGLLGYAPRALDSLNRVERATYCKEPSRKY